FTTQKSSQDGRSALWGRNSSPRTKSRHTPCNNESNNAVISMIQIRNLEKSFPTRPSPTYVLRQIMLDITEGEFITIMGPSGAGKSTLLSVIGFYDHSWEGEYHFNGEAVHRLKPKERAALNKRHIGFVFQQFHLLEDLT